MASAISWMWSECIRTGQDAQSLEPSAPGFWPSMTREKMDMDACYRSHTTSLRRYGDCTPSRTPAHSSTAPLDSRRLCCWRLGRNRAYHRSDDLIACEGNDNAVQ